MSLLGGNAKEPKAASEKGRLRRSFEPLLGLVALSVELTLLWELHTYALEARIAPTDAGALGLAELANTVAAIGFMVVMSLATTIWALLLHRFVGAREAAERLIGEQEAARRGEERFRSLVHNATDLVAIVESDSTIRYVTRSAERALGRSPDDLVDSRMVDLVHPDDLSSLLEFLDRTGRLVGASGRSEYRLRRHDGTWLPVEALGTDLSDDPSIQGLVLTMRDVADRKALEDQLTHQALHDPLTGLPNRALFADRVSHALARRDRPPGTLAVFFLDLDDFKTVNDSLGHAAGDDVLNVVAARLELHLRESDTAARLGGDEFAVLLEDVAGAEEAIEIAKRIGAALREPTVIGGVEHTVSSSLGIAVHADETRAEDLLRSADIAMYMAKRAGNGDVEIYKPAMHRRVLARLALKADLRRAVEQQQFEVHYQPTVALASGAITGVEALVRWHHPERGMVGPNEFIPLAEETGLIHPIGQWVLETACAQVHAWHLARPGAPLLNLNVNVSPRQLEQATIVDDITDIVTTSGIDARTLVLEITENALIDITVETLGKLGALKDLGLRLAIDDFGTGYSSLSYLRGLPVDILKIDKSFIDDVDGAGAALASTIVDLGLKLGLETIAEGIEQAQQVTHLTELDCRYGQGFYFARPVAADAMDAVLVRELPLPHSAKPLAMNVG